MNAQFPMHEFSLYFVKILFIMGMPVVARQYMSRSPVSEAQSWSSTTPMHVGGQTIILPLPIRWNELNALNGKVSPTLSHTPKTVGRIRSQ